MPMIQGIDGSALLNALRAGRQDRMIYDEQQAKRATAEREAAREDQITGLMGQLFGGAAPAGVAEQVLPQASPSPPAASPPAVATVAPARRPNPQVLAQLIALDPETGGKIASAFKTMDESNLKATEAKNTMMGAAAHSLMQFPPDQRAAMLQTIAPQLAEAGWTPEEIARADLSDNGLKMLQATSIDLDAMIDNELAERQFQQGKVITPQPGEGAFRLKPDGTVETLIQPNPGGLPTGGAVNDIPAEAIAALKSGEGSAEQFDEVFGAGAAERIMGGAGGNAGGGF